MQEKLLFCLPCIECMHVCLACSGCIACGAGGNPRARRASPSLDANGRGGPHGAAPGAAEVQKGTTEGGNVHGKVCDRTCGG